jgi:hypothetical protein
MRHLTYHHVWPQADSLIIERPGSRLSNLPAHTGSTLDIGGTSVTRDDVREGVFDTRIDDTATTRASGAQTWLLERLYVVRDWKRVTAFTQAHPELVPLLFELYAVVNDIFKGSKVVLEVRSDFDEYANDIMVAYIVSLFKPEETLQLLEEFDHYWWLDAMKQADGLLLVNFAY